MFTGIIETTGTIRRILPQEQGVRLEIESGAMPMTDVAVGDSIAVNGVCLTVVAYLPGGVPGFVADVSPETLRCTTGLASCGPVNLERALRLADRLGGHLVSGHVDGVATIDSIVPVGENHELIVRAPLSLMRFIAAKGSVTLNGVSLTVNWVEGDRFSINLIPHTWQVTTLGTLQEGAAVNLEVDMLARYTARLLGLVE